MGQVNQPSNLLDRVRRLEQHVRRLAAQGGLTSATIDRGGLTLLQDAFFRVVDDQGVEILYVGPDDQGRQIIRMRREGGTDVLFTYFTDGGDQYWALSDRSGNQLIADDATSGLGLARPYLAWNLLPTAELSSIPSNQTTTSSAFTGVWTAYGEQQHPRLRLIVLTRAESATTGEIRVRDVGTNTVLAGPITIPSADNTIRIIDGTLPAGHLDVRQVDVEIRRTSGVGVVSARALVADGVQSA